jgi:dual specificity phosphatase 12
MALNSDLKKPSLSEIIPGLFIGNELSTWDVPTLSENHVTAVASLVYGGASLWQRSKFTRHVPKERHLYIGCKDSSTQDLLKNLDTICDFIDRMMRQGSTNGNSNTLVHYSHGISRSATAVIAYLMRKYRKDLGSVLDQVRARRPLVKPSANFMVQLEIWEQLEYQIWEDEAKTIPKKAYADWLDQRLILCKEKGLTGYEPDTPQDLSDL